MPKQEIGFDMADEPSVSSGPSMGTPAPSSPTAGGEAPSFPAKSAISQRVAASVERTATQGSGVVATTAAEVTQRMLRSLRFK